MAIFNDEPTVLTFPEVEVTTEIGVRARVILFNDEVHTFDEVADQIVRATGCTHSQADALTLEVHSRGKAMVFDGAMDVCLKVSWVLEEIDLMTQIEC